MNKRLAVVFTLMVVIVFQLHQHGNTEGIHSSAVDPLFEIAEVMSNHNVDIEEWSVYGRADVNSINTIEKYEKRVSEMKTSSPQFTWNTSAQDGIIETIGTYTDESFNLHEKIKFVAYPHKDQIKAYLIYVVNGDNWSADLGEKYFPIFEEKIGRMFDKYPLLFSCVSGQTSDNMEGVLYNQALTYLDEFSAKPIEALREETFVSVSAYNGNWKNNIPGKNEEMNIQIALREGLGGSTTVVIGTPIITSEY